MRQFPTEGARRSAEARATVRGPGADGSVASARARRADSVGLAVFLAALWTMLTILRVADPDNHQSIDLAVTGGFAFVAFFWWVEVWHRHRRAQLRTAAAADAARADGRFDDGT